MREGRSVDSQGSYTDCPHGNWWCRAVADPHQLLWPSGKNGECLMSLSALMETNDKRKNMCHEDIFDKDCL